jgi:DNA-directed RNA polymerase II subunit RPB1
MSIHQEKDYTPDISKLAGVQFSVMSQDQIRKRSVAEIYTHETYDGDVPKIGGLFDPRMGVIDHGKKCPTDELDNRSCPGYFGHIELAKSVFNYHFLKYTIKALQCVCWKCSKLLISPNDPEVQKIVSSKRGFNRFNAIYNLASKVKKCNEKNEGGCGKNQPTIIKRDVPNIGHLLAEWRTSDKEDKVELKLDADDVRNILRRISDEECDVMGFPNKLCRPDWLICSVLPVAPPAVRPSVRADNNNRMEDDLTHKLCDIIKTNKTLKNKIKQNAPQSQIDQWYFLLQYHVATLVDNNIPGVPPAIQRSGRALKAIKDRLSAKEGRVRGNLMGKRVDYSARSVITPDMRIGIAELGVPMDIAMNLTVPEKVNAFNIEKLTRFVQNGYHKYPGAKTIKRVLDGQIVSLQYRTNLTLNIGDIVNRHLMDGDKVLFNRQPSLHKMSMMCHTARVLPYKTFRLNPSVTKPYNADFDKLISVENRQP